MITIVLWGRPLTQTSCTASLRVGPSRTKALEPSAKRLLVVPFTTEGVAPAEAMVDVRCAALQQGFVVVVVDPLKVTSSDALDDRVIHRSLRRFGADKGSAAYEY